jgi:tetratricopeptide (TPR) repeat protein
LTGLACSRDAQHYLQSANRAFEQGKFEDAEIQFQNALRKDPNSGEAVRGLGLTALRQNKMQLAFQSLSRAVQLLPEDASAKVAFADLCLAAYLANPERPQNLYTEVLRLADMLLAKETTSFDGYRLKATLAMADRKPREAIELFRAADEKRPMQPLVVVPLAEALLQDNQVAAAEDLARRVIATEKKFEPIYDVLYVYYTKSKRWEDAEKILRTKVDNNPRSAGSWMQLISHYNALKRTPEADGLIRKMLETPQEFPGVRRHLGDFYARTGNHAEALRQYELGVTEAAGEQPLYQKRMASSLTALGKVGEAVRLLDAVLQVNPNDKEAGQMRASANLQSGDRQKVEAGVRELRALSEKDPADADLLWNLGRAQLQTGDLAGARTAIAETVRRRPGLQAARFALIEVYLRLGQGKEALQETQQILAAEPANVRARLLRGMSLATLQQYPEARNELSRLAQEQPQLADAQLQLGLVAVAEKKFAEADAIFQRLYKPGQGDLGALGGLVASQAAQNQFERALQLIGDELKRNPGSAALRSALASTATRARKYDLAVAEYERLVADHPQEPNLRVLLSQVQQLRGNLEAAVEIARKATEMAPGAALPRAMLASVLDLAGRKEEAIASYRKGLELQPGNPEVLNNLAFLLAEARKDLDDALRMAQQAQKQSPDSPAVADTIGFVYLQKGQPDAALQIFSNLSRKYPDKSLFHYRCAVALLAKGDKAKAQEALHKALSTGPDKAGEVQIRELLKKLG